jgi:hypothetical protein
LFKGTPRAVPDTRSSGHQIKLLLMSASDPPRSSAALVGPERRVRAGSLAPLPPTACSAAMLTGERRSSGSSSCRRRSRKNGRPCLLLCAAGGARGLLCSYAPLAELGTSRRKRGERHRRRSRGGGVGERCRGDRWEGAVGRAKRKGEDKWMTSGPRAGLLG